MTNSTPDLQGKVAFITGSARRIGAEIAKTLHAAGMNVVVHCRLSSRAAHDLRNQLNSRRTNSCNIVQADIGVDEQRAPLIKQVAEFWGRLDVLVNNASSFYPTPVGSITLDQWDNLINSNLKAPLFLSQDAAPLLKETNGCIVNMVDIHAFRPMLKHPVYCAAKAGLAMLTLSLARELGPEVRVNGVAPGAILWPEHDMNEHTKHIILDRTALKRHGEPSDIAKTVLFLVRDANYITGQIIPVDGGRSLNI